MISLVLCRPHLRILIVLALFAGVLVAPTMPADATSHVREISISDAQVDEGDTGTSTMTFTVTVDPAPEGLESVSVDYQTSDFTARAGEDYEETSGTLTFTHLDAGTETVDITINGDTLQEENETFFVGLSSASEGRIVDGSGVGTIINDDGPAISVADAQAPEGSGVVSFPVTLDAAANEAIDVTYATSGDTATAGDDYTETTGTVTIPAGATQASIEVPTLDDDSDEPNETFDIVLSAPTNDATLADDEAVGTILDDDDPATIAIADVAVAEEDGPTLDQTAMEFRVTVTGATDKAISFDFATTDGTAEAGILRSGDYTARSGSRTIPAGSTQTTITVQANRDTTPEAHEEFTVALTNIINAGVTDDVATGVIRNDDATLSIADATPVQEGSGPAEFDVTIPFPTIGDVSATVDTTDGAGDAGATSPQDYAAIVDGEVVIPEGQTSATVPVTVKTDDRDEPDTETFTAELSAPTNATIDDGTATGSIQDIDALPNLVVDDLDFDPEDHSGQRTEQVRVRLVDGADQPVISDRDVVVEWSTRDGTATAGDDYASGNGELIIPAGTDTAATPAEIDVVVNGDTTAEADETFFVELDEGSLTNAEIANGTGTVTIRDDDETLTIEDATVVEGDSTVDVTVRLGRTLGEGESVTVDYVSADDTAEDGVDYTSVDDTLTFSAGEQVKTIPVGIVDDAVSEDDETFTITLSEPNGAIIAPDGQTATVTILDDEDPRLFVDDASVVEGDSGTTSMDFTVRLLGGTTTGPVEFDYATSDDTATASTLDPVITGDYVGTTSGSGTIASGDTSTTLTVPVNGDTEAEDFETFDLVISNPRSDVPVGIADDTAVGTIENDDATVSVADVEVAEGDSSDFLVTLSHPVAFDVDVAHALAPGTAEESDFSDNDDTVTIPAGATTSPIALQATGDEIDEDAETVDLALTDLVTSDNVTIPEGEATGTITDDDAPPTISIDDIVIDEGDNGVVVEGVLTVTLSAPTERGDVTVDYSTADDTAQAGSDYSADTDTVTIPAGELATTVTVFVAGDTLDEVDETFRVELADPTWATIADGSGRVTIRDDDQGTLSIDDAAVDESDAGQTTQLDFTVTLSAPAPFDVDFRVDTRDGTATADSDYTAVSAQRETIPAGQTSTTVSITVLGDEDHEPNEAFDVVLSDATNATIDDGVGQGLIRDDDQAPMAPTAVAGSYPATTEGEAIEFDGSGSGDPDGEVTTYHWDFGDGTTGTGETVTHSYADDGAYTVALTVTDDDGDSDTDTTPVTVHNTDPTITIDADGSAAPDEQKVMTATVDDPGADELSVAWDLGDGTEATGSSVTHAWANAGSYTVTATVTDDDGGSAEDTVTVTVTAADDGGGPNAPSDSDTVTRSAGGDRILTAVQVSRDHWPDGRSTAQGSDAAATDVVLARSDLYPDALAAGPLTAALDAPLLLTYPGELPEVVEGELARLGAGTVWLLGGELAISADVEARLEALGYQVERLSGADRFATAAAVAAEVGPAATNEVVVALGDHDTDDARAWPDALSAGSLSASPDRLPVLLTAQGTVPEATADALASLAPRTVHILGGPVAIRAEVDAQLAGLGYRTNRLAGGTRYTTGIAVAADALARQAQTKVPVVLATGTNFPDGLAAGALAARLGGIVLLVPHDLDSAPEVTAFLADHADRFDHAVVIGGPHVVPEVVRDQVLTAIASD